MPEVVREDERRVRQRDDRAVLERAWRRSPGSSRPRWRPPRRDTPRSSGRTTGSPSRGRSRAGSARRPPPTGFEGLPDGFPGRPAGSVVGALGAGRRPELPGEDRGECDDQSTERLSALAHAAAADWSKDRPRSHRASLSRARDGPGEDAVELGAEPEQERSRSARPRPGCRSPTGPVARAGPRGRTAPRTRPRSGSASPRSCARPSTRGPVVVAGPFEEGPVRRASPDTRVPGRSTGRTSARRGPPAWGVPRGRGSSGARSTIEDTPGRRRIRSPTASGRPIRTHASYGHACPSHRCSPNE